MRIHVSGIRNLSKFEQGHFNDIMHSKAPIFVACVGCNIIIGKIPSQPLVVHLCPSKSVCGDAALSKLIHMDATLNNEIFHPHSLFYNPSTDYTC